MTLDGFSETGLVFSILRFAKEESSLIPGMSKMCFCLRTGRVFNRFILGADLCHTKNTWYSRTTPSSDQGTHVVLEIELHLSAYAQGKTLTQYTSLSLFLSHFKFLIICYQIICLLYFIGT